MNAPLSKEQTALLMSDSLTYRTPAVEGMAHDAAPASRTLFQWFGSMASALAARFRRRAVIDELSSLSDRELADIGLNRSELGRVFDVRFAESRQRPASAGLTHAASV